MIIILTILGYFAILLTVSRVTGGKTDNDTFYRGNRHSPWYMVAFGMIGASISGITFVSVPGMVLKTDMTYMQTCLGFSSLHPAANILQEQPHYDILLSGTQTRVQIVQDWSVLLSAVKNDRSFSKVLCSMLYPSQFCI